MSKTSYFILVDIEAAGPHPGRYALLSIGAVPLEDDVEAFYVELCPDREEADPAAMSIHSLSLEELKEKGTPPAEAMQAFADWIARVTPAGRKPVFVAFNAPFDWMFITEYFYRTLGYNPFGHKALDLKALFMGAYNVDWPETSHKFVSKIYNLPERLPHQALEDARQEKEIFKKILALMQERSME